MLRFCPGLITCLSSNQNYYWLRLCNRLLEATMKYAMKFLGPVLLLIGNALISSIIVCYLLLCNFSSNMEIFTNTYGSERLKSVHIDDIPYGQSVLMINTLLCLFFAGNLCFNYLLCILTKPGSPAICDDPELYLGHAVIGQVNGRKVYGSKPHLDISPGISYRYCRKCRCIKPPRCHHCSILGRCVFDMDHFCPWMNNTVGHYNYRYFVLFLLYTFLGSAHICLSLYLQPLRAMFIRSHSNSMIKSAFIYLFTINLSSMVSVGGLLGWHIYLICTNQTTLEFYINYDMHLDATATGSGASYRNPYDRGWRKNLRRVFGDMPWYLSLLPSTRLPPEPEHPFQLPIILSHV